MVEKIAMPIVPPLSWPVEVGEVDSNKCGPVRAAA
jgi:hypothetical protein